MLEHGCVNHALGIDSYFRTSLTDVCMDTHGWELGSHWDGSAFFSDINYYELLSTHPQGLVI